MAYHEPVMNQIRGSIRLGALFAVVLSLAGLTAVVMAFLSNASPYVSVAEAKAKPGDNQHLSGDIVPGSVVSDLHAGTVRFKVKDSDGQVADVLYQGPPPSNMASATKVVAVGGMKDGVFTTKKLILKCPSKYEGTK